MRRRRPRRTVRAVTAAAFAVLLALGGISVGAGVRAEHSAERLATSGDLVGAYLDLTRAVAIQDAAEEAEGPSAVQGNRRRFRHASDTIARALAVIERIGDPADQALRAEIARNERLYRSDIHRYFSAIEAGNAGRAAAAEMAADEPSQALQQLVSEGGPRQATASLAEIDDLRRSQASSLRLTLAAVLLGMGVVAGLWGMLRSLRRRIDDATNVELVRLEHAALTDSLTGIRNHRAFEEDLARALAHTRRHGTDLSLVMLDLDGLKRVNDADGHQAGDRAIRAVAETLAGTVRASETVYRVGGDEFAALLPVTGAWGAFLFARRLHDAIGAIGSGIAVSVGIAQATGVSTRDGLVEEADTALLEAKAGGRATIIFLPGMARPAPTEVDGDDRHRGTLAAALARAVDAKDPYTRSHSETVAELCGLIAAGLGLDPEHVTAVRLAGLVHDVGKIGVPDAILQKPAALDDQEFEVIKTHSSLGHKILRGTDPSREAPWVLHHHERLDGGGYPAGLSGEEIPVESRIIHVADAFEAMTSDRPYRRRRPQAEALAELHRHAGSQFDPACVDALVRGLGATTDRKGGGSRLAPATAGRAAG